MKVRLKEIGAFYLVLLVPLIYGINLWLVSRPGGLNVGVGIRAVGLTLALVGIVLGGVSYYYLRSAFGILPKKKTRVREGVYRYLGHPMYLGIELTFVGLSLSNQSLRGLLFSLFVLLPMLLIRIVLEERTLID